MKYFPLFLLVCTTGICGSKSRADSAPIQAAKPHYSNIWRPIDDVGIRQAVQNNKRNPLGLEDLMTRSLLQSKAVSYLLAVEEASKADPKNANLVAAYGWGLAMSRGSYVSSGQPIPPALTTHFNLDHQFIRDTIQHARDLDPHCWLADIAEASLAAGGSLGHETPSAALAKRAYAISQNRLTMTTYGAELRFQGMLMAKPEMIKQGVALLSRAQRLYPTYWRVQMETCFAYTNKHVRNIAKSKAAARNFMALIPPESRNLPWVRRYVDYLGIEKLQ